MRTTQNVSDTVVVVSGAQAHRRRGRRPRARAPRLLPARRRRVRWAFVSEAGRGGAAAGATRRERAAPPRPGEAELAGRSEGAPRDRGKQSSPDEARARAAAAVIGTREARPPRLDDAELVEQDATADRRPAPSLAAFGDTPAFAPGAFLCAEGAVALNAGRELMECRVTNTGDRPIQVGSHYHFLETNAALKFDRGLAYGRRLNVPSGSSVRFEPGESKVVTLVDIAGARVVRSGNNLTDGAASPDRLAETLERVAARGFLHEPEANPKAGAALELPRASYAELFGPTTGDVVRLADTSLSIKVEKDHTVYGDECKFGGGKTLREGMGQQTGCAAADALDTVITNALIVDAVLGVVKADVGLKGNRIVGIGKAGNPDVMDGVTPGMTVGVTTEAIAGEKLILTAGGVDTHIHFICPQQCEDAVASGLTTMH